MCPFLVFFDHPNAVVAPGSDSARTGHCTISHAGLPRAASGLRWLVEVMFVGKPIGPGPCALSRIAFAFLWGRCFSQARMKFCFPKQVAAKHGLLLFLLFLALLAHSLLSKITMWKNNSILPNSFSVPFAGCAILSVS